MNIHHPDLYADGLLCHTDKLDCCGGSQTGGALIGHWYLPDGAIINSYSEIDAITDENRPHSSFTRNRGQSLIRLYIAVYRDNPLYSLLERGRFCCVVPNAAGVDTTICANICKL